MVVSASAHKPQKMQLPRSSLLARSPLPSSKLIAPVGQTAAAGRASAHLSQSISGRPRARLETSGGASGYFVVTTPVVRLLPSILNINQRSVPEYEKLKLLFTTGKSGMIFPRIASVIAGQFCREGSLTLHLANRPPAPARIQ